MCSSPAATSAPAPRASRRRKRSSIWGSRRSSPSRTPGSSTATRSTSACPRSSARKRSASARATNYGWTRKPGASRTARPARRLRPSRCRPFSWKSCATAACSRISKSACEPSALRRNAARPPHSEGLAVFIASYLANETALPTINLLHLSSRKALEAALKMQQVFPHIDFRRKVTIGHLILDVNSRAGVLAKVNPPIRPRDDVEYLWQQLLAGKVDWVVSDHACCRHETKAAKNALGNIWLAKSGFGGTEYLLPALVSEGMKRGLALNRVAELTSRNPAQRFGLHSKGDIAEGLDADVVLVDPKESWTIRAAESQSTQGYTPFEGIELGARVKATFLRGELVCENGNIVGKPRGQYLHRPTV